MRKKLCFLAIVGSAFLTFAMSLYCPAAVDYVVGEGDIIKITVYDHPDLTTVARIGGDKTISFPLIGLVNVGGLSVSQVADTLAAKLADGYLINPQVSVFIEEFRSRKTTIMGKVQRPGLYELHGQTTFLELLSKAGGLAPEAGDRAIVKRRQTPSGPETEVIAIDLKKLIEEGDTSHDIRIMDGDSVFIGEAGTFYISGEVKKPDAYKLGQGTTVIKAITLAGGFTEKAARDRVVIVRDVGERQETIQIGAGGASWDFRIMKGDSISVPEAGIYYVTGEVKKPGSYAYEPGATVLKAVTVAGGFTDKASKRRIRIIRVVDGVEKTIKGVDFDDTVEPEDVIVVPESFF